MRMILNKGHRIRASDKNLVYRFSMGTLLFVFVAVILLLNTKQLMRTDWEHFSLLDNIILLSYFMDMSDSEISEFIKIPRSNVQYHRTKTLEAMRKIMEERK